jgi:3'-phosphoadenosine 5'-phosphosulfate sulfotransferase (PAPS reductase)/FAD synthetase
MTKILAFGIGVQTCAMLFKFHKDYDYFVFSDTGDEKPETYLYLKEYVNPFIEKIGLQDKFIVVKNNKYFSLYDYCIQHKQIPMRNFRWCTDKFKRSPINKFCKSIGATKKNPIIKCLGISLDESDRVNEFSANKKEPKYIKLEYPLLDLKISRKDCEKIILESGYPIPVKSGCWYCPYAKKEEFRRLKIDRPDLFEKIVVMEENNNGFPERKLKYSKSFRELDFNYSLEDFEADENTCDSAHCMT